MPQNNGMNSQNFTDRFHWRETLLNPMNKSHHSYRLWSMLMTEKTSVFINMHQFAIGAIGFSMANSATTFWFQPSEPPEGLGGDGRSSRGGLVNWSSQVRSKRVTINDDPFLDSLWPVDVSNGSLLLWDQRFWVFLRCFSSLFFGQDSLEICLWCARLKLPCGFAFDTVDGRNPKQPPGMVLKPCK